MFADVSLPLCSNLVLLGKIAQALAKDFSVFLWLLLDVMYTTGDVQGHSWQEGEGCQQLPP